jgi:hypothetical protein
MISVIVQNRLPGSHNSYGIHPPLMKSFAYFAISVVALLILILPLAGAALSSFSLLSIASLILSFVTILLFFFISFLSGQPIAFVFLFAEPCPEALYSRVVRWRAVWVMWVPFANEAEGAHIVIVEDSVTRESIWPQVAHSSDL